MSLKNVVKMADEVAELKISNKSAHPSVDEKKINNKMDILKFRAGVSGRKNVQKYLQEKHDMQQYLTELNREEAYNLYQQHAAYDETGKLIEERERTTESMTTTEVVLEEVLEEPQAAPDVEPVAEVVGESEMQVEIPVELMGDDMIDAEISVATPIVHVRRTPSVDRTSSPLFETASFSPPGGGRDAPKSPPPFSGYSSPTTTTMTDLRTSGEKAWLSPKNNRTKSRGGMSWGRGATPGEGDGKGSGDLNLGFSPSLTREPSEVKPKTIWCDYEMCRGKFNKVLEAVFWSQTSNKVYCTYCWGLVASHQPHGVMVSYGDEVEEEEKKVRLSEERRRRAA
jgi:hypothetical protein